MRNLLSKLATPINIQRTTNPFSSISNELNRAINAFECMFDRINEPSERFESLSMMPAINIIDDKDSFKVEFEMPGMDENDIDVSIGDSVLRVKGEKTVSKKNQDKNYMAREICYGNYERSIMLPDSVDTDNANASFKKGMLWVVFPKKIESIEKSRTLTIEKAK